MICLLLASMLGMQACDKPGAVDSNGMPKKLILATVAAENINQVKEVREKVRAILEKKLGMPVEMIQTNDYTGVIEALKAKKVHMADIPPFAYVIATRAMKLNPLVTIGQDGKAFTYQSVIISNAHSNIKTMADVKANAKNLTLAFVDPASTSGHLIPRAYLNTIGLNPDNAFKQTIFAGNHLAAVLAVKSGKVDVACTTSVIFNLMKQQKMIADGDVRVLWTSDPIVAQPIVVRDDVNKDFAKKIQDAYLSINTEEPELLRKYVKIFLPTAKSAGFVIVRDSDYNGLRKIAAGVKDLKDNH
jgi:phosphonate transport system substrate-binding protein